ncbi:ArsR/SmtB family transcription factor [Priestia flexa]|uniref:ArsR/SmtB family transcription factor n=1 Tax=Priestia flexa TaxID=86664 RepID=UPI00240DFDDB|nr:metalloregulator ArsR/SmtB family transcription factor [Priestia flexa]WEZ06568.1 metalloregulator ArsR/SmtB family transcription factor [Priestia flexa]
MQLKRIVDFHKTMGDPTRIRILSLLKSGPLNGQAIAGKLGLKPPTITHHMAKLRDIGLIKERRDKNTIYFYLNVKALEASATAILTIVNEEVIETVEENDRIKILKPFFTADGKPYVQADKLLLGLGLLKTSDLKMYKPTKHSYLPAATTAVGAGFEVEWDEEKKELSLERDPVEIDNPIDDEDGDIITN